MSLLGFRDPHAFVKDQALALGLEDQADQPLFDDIDTLTRDQASYLRLLLLADTDSFAVIHTTKEHFQRCLDSAHKFYVLPEISSTMQ